MLRTIITLAFVVIFLIISIPIWAVLFIVGLFSKEAKDKAGFAIVKWAFHVVWLLAGAKPEIVGLEKIPKDTAVLYVGNHQSFFDVVLAYSLCPSVTGFLSKKEFEKVPLLSVWMHMLYCLFLTRTDPRADLKLIIKAQEFIKSGISMFVFPEGTRSKTGEMAAFHEASFKIATKTGCPIVPVCFTATRDIFESHFPKLKKTKVIITYCDPIIPSELEGDDKKYIGAYVQNLMKEQLAADKAKL